MTTIGAERPDTEVAVILGVDTHLDAHAAVKVALPSCTTKTSS